MSKKNTLLKLSVRRFIPDSELVLVSGFDYTTTFAPKAPTSVYQGTTSLTFSYSNGVLSLTSITAPDSDIFVDYDLYFTTGATINDYDNPVDQTGSIVEWQPRLASNFTSKQSSSDMIYGFMSISSSSAILDNNDSALNQYFTKYDNWRGKNFTSYILIGSTYRRFSSGTISKYSSGTTITLSLKNMIGNLNTEATLGNARQYYKINSIDYPSVNSKYENKPIMHLSGYLSDVPTFTSDSNNRIAEFSNLPIATKIAYNDFILGTVKNPYPVSGQLVAVTWNSNFLIGAIGYDNLTVPAAHTRALIVGSEVGITRSDAVSAYANVYAIDYDTNIVTIENSSGFNITDILIPPAYIHRDDGGRILAAYSGTVTFGPASKLEVNFSTATNGDKLIKCRWNNFTVITDPSFIEGKNPRFIITSTTIETQSDYIKRQIEGAGYSVITSQFTSAQTDSNLGAYITTGKGLVENETVQKQVEKIAFSNNGFVFWDDQQEKYGYKILKTSMGTPDWNLTKADILENTLIPNVENQDVYTEIASNNGVIGGGQWLSAVNTRYVSEFAENFSETEKQFVFTHYSDSTSSEKIKFITTPDFFYKFTVKPDEYYAMQIGDVVNISNVNGKLLTESDTVDLVIIALEKSSELVRVTGYDFSKIP